MLCAFSCSMFNSRQGYRLPAAEEELFSMSDLADAIHAVWQRTTPHPERFKPVVVNGKKITTETMGLDKYFADHFTKEKFPEAYNEAGKLLEVFKKAHRVNPENNRLEVDIVPLANRYLAGFGNENTRAAKEASLALKEILAHANPDNEKDMRALIIDWLEHIHQRWLEENTWAATDPLYSPKFVDLNPDMQQADLNQLQAAFRTYIEKVKKKYADTNSPAWGKELALTEGVIKALRITQARVVLTTRVAKEVYGKVSSTSYNGHFRPIIFKGKKLKAKELDNYLDEVPKADKLYLKKIGGVWYEDVISMPFAGISPAYRAEVEFLSNQTLKILDEYPFRASAGSADEAAVFMTDSLNKVTRQFLHFAFDAKAQVLFAANFAELPHHLQKKILAVMGTAMRFHFNTSEATDKVFMVALHDREKTLERTERIAKNIHESLKAKATHKNRMNTVRGDDGKTVKFSKLDDYMKTNKIQPGYKKHFAKLADGNLSENIYALPYNHLSEGSRAYYEASANLSQRVLNGRSIANSDDFEKSALEMAQSLERTRIHREEFSKHLNKFYDELDVVTNGKPDELVDSEVREFMERALEEMRSQWAKISEKEAELPFFKKSWKNLPPDFQRESLLVLRACIEEKFPNISSNALHRTVRKTLKVLEGRTEDVTDFADRLHASWQKSVDKSKRPEVFKPMLDYAGQAVKEWELDNFLAAQNIPDSYRSQYQVVDGSVVENILEIPNRHLSPSNKLANDLGAIDAFVMFDRRFANLEGLTSLSRAEMDLLIKHATDDMNKAWLEWNPEKKSATDEAGRLIFDNHFDSRSAQTNKYNLSMVQEVLEIKLDKKDPKTKSIFSALARIKSGLGPKKGFVGSCLEQAAKLLEFVR